MEKLRIHVCGTDIHVTELGKLTTGMVGATASFSFSPEWNGMLKTAVFCGGIKKDVILTGNTVKIPPECIRTPALTVGVFGHLADGTVVIPTVMSGNIGVSIGTKPSGDTQSGYTPDKWMQMIGMIGDLSMLTTEARNNLVAAINELAARSAGEVDPEQIRQLVQEYLAANPPQVKETDPTVPAWAKQPQKPSYTAAEVGAQPKGNYVKTVNGVAPDENGNVNVASGSTPDLSGYAKKEDIPSLDGYAKTADIPSALPNPNALTFTGAVQATYDGSKPMSVEIPQGGGGDSPWRKITDFTTEEEVATLFITQDDEGKTFKLKEIYFYVNALANSEGKTTSYFRFGVNPKNQHDCIWQTATGLPQTGFRWAQAVLALVGDVWVAQNTRTQINTASTFGGGYESNLSKSTPITTPAECVTFNFMGNIGVGSQIVIYGRDAA